MVVKSGISGFQKKEKIIIKYFVIIKLTQFKIGVL